MILMKFTIDVIVIFILLTLMVVDDDYFLFTDIGVLLIVT